MGKVISIMPDFGLGAYAWMKEDGHPPFPGVGSNIADSVSWGAKDIPISKSAFGFCYLPQLPVKALYRIRGIDNAANRTWIAEHFGLIANF